MVPSNCVPHPKTGVKQSLKKFLNRAVNRMQTTSLVQTLFDLCKKTFSASGPAPSNAAINRIRSLLDTFKPIDVGLNEDPLEQDRGYGCFGQNIQRNRHSAMAARWSQPVTYLHIYECDNFTIGIFCFPTSAVIPLHDHPGMIVLSKLLYGSMHVKAYDWVDPLDVQKSTGRSQLRLAKLKADTVITAPCEPSVLYPTTGGNIHSFTAVTSCAVLDVLAPPYSDTAGRHCTYYRDYPYESFPGLDYASSTAYGKLRLSPRSNIFCGTLLIKGCHWESLHHPSVGSISSVLPMTGQNFRHLF